MDDFEFSPEQIRRAVRQQLEGLRRDGITHWNRIPAVAPQSVTTPATPTTVGTRTAAPTTVTNIIRPQLDSPQALVQAPIVAKPNLFDQPEPVETPKKKSTVPFSTCATFQPLELPLAERITGLAAVAERVKACMKCQELASTRTQTVFGVGNPQAKILFVGEAPGADEDAQGEPFVGKSGQLLNDIIKACRMKREEIYICNILRCRPPGNRLPEPDEAANCREFLDSQIAHVNPEYIVCWGACAAQNLLGTTESIGKMRGRFMTYGRAKVVCTYHPSYLLRNPAAKKDVWEDMKFLFKDMGIDLSAKGA